MKKIYLLGGIALIIAAIVIVAALFNVAKKNAPAQKQAEQTQPEAENVAGQPNGTQEPATGENNNQGGQSAPAQNVYSVGGSAATPPVSTKFDPKNAPDRDQTRGSDLRRAAAAQNNWYTDHKKYYTCGIAGGNCGGRSNNLPLVIGAVVLKISDPVSNGKICGQSYTYCGLDNSRDSSKFCYYAKLETGGFYTVSQGGNYKRDTVPLTLAECGTAPNTPIKSQTFNPNAMTTTAQRDLERQTDMNQLIVAQANWFGVFGRYYTCGAASGDCSGRANSYPATLGSYLIKTPVDPSNTGSICGRDYVYCGLDNTNALRDFCYFAKLETGGYQTASPAGSFKRSTPPASFVQCGQPN